VQAVKDQFVAELAKSNKQSNLAKLALLMAQYLTHPFDTAPFLRILDDIADSVAEDICFAPNDAHKIELLNDCLFTEYQFSGNQQAYYHPDNSLLNRVLETGKGIPITLSLVYIEIGARLDLPVWGVGIPRHFIVGYGNPGNPIYIDAFSRGKILSEADCLELSHVSAAQLAQFRERFLKPVSTRSILFRMLANLKYIYVSKKDWEAAYKTIDLMLAIHPGQLTELKERGLLARRLDRLHDAVIDLKRFLFLAPNHVDADWVEQQIETLETELLRLN
jgi:regulator of sirC expression with transglutaminase-like and TPR domain